MKKVLLFALVAASTAAMAQNTVTFQCGIPSTTTGVTSVDVTGNWVNAAGLGTDWSNALTLTDANSDGVWEGTASLPDGSYECKFRTYNAAGGPNWETVPSTCATGGNRALVVAGSAVTLSACLGSCDATCPTYTPVTLTFRINMAGVNLSVPANSTTSSGAPVNAIVNVTGSFGLDAGYSNFAPGTIEMLDADGDMVYEKTVTVLNKVYGWKCLIADAWEALDPIDPSIYNQFAEQGPAFTDYSCLDNQTPTNLTNRQMDLTAVPSGGSFTIEVDWQKCVSTVGTSNVLSTRYYFAQPNPFTGETVIRFSNDNNETFGLTLTNAMGQVVRSINNITTDNVTIDSRGLAAGMYFATLRNQAGQTLALKVIAQ